MKKYIGVLEGWFETGTEGTVWVLQEDGKTGYDGMRVLRRGDHLKIFGENGEVLFDDLIIPDMTAGLTASPLNPEYKQPSALGFWIHWTQRGWLPDDWAKLFLREVFKQKPLRAELIRY